MGQTCHFLAEHQQNHSQRVYFGKMHLPTARLYPKLKTAAGFSPSAITCVIPVLTKGRYRRKASAHVAFTNCPSSLARLRLTSELCVFPGKRGSEEPPEGKSKVPYMSLKTSPLPRETHHQWAQKMLFTTETGHMDLSGAPQRQPQRLSKRRARRTRRRAMPRRTRGARRAAPPRLPPCDAAAPAGRLPKGTGQGCGLSGVGCVPSCLLGCWVGCLVVLIKLVVAVLCNVFKYTGCGWDDLQTVLTCSLLGCQERTVCVAKRAEVLHAVPEHWLVPQNGNLAETNHSERSLLG